MYALGWVVCVFFLVLYPKPSRALVFPSQWNLTNPQKTCWMLAVLSKNLKEEKWFENFGKSWMMWSLWCWVTGRGRILQHIVDWCSSHIHLSTLKLACSLSHPHYVLEWIGAAKSLNHCALMLFCPLYLILALLLGGEETGMKDWCLWWVLRSIFMKWWD